MTMRSGETTEMVVATEPFGIDDIGIADSHARAAAWRTQRPS
jgi:hypothetical protein